jgi:putative oxidoreductase
MRKLLRGSHGSPTGPYTGKAPRNHGATSFLGHRFSLVLPPKKEEENTMTSQTTGKMRHIITWVLRVLLGVTFLGIGIEKITGTMGTIPFFDAIGWGQWFRYVSGALDTAGALLILVPRWTSLGALIITCTVGLGTYLCYAKALFNPLFPLIMTLLAATLVWLAWKPKAS